jgi:protein O-mannosyl-transferase
MQRTTFIVLILLAAVAAAYGQLVTQDFLMWDDPGTVATNPRMNPPSLSSVLYYWRAPEHGLYVPVTYSAWGVLASAARVDEPDPRGVRLNPAVFKLANVVVHAAAACMVLAILRRLLHQDWPAALGALLYALHPIQVEAVAWVSGLKDLLAGAFGLAAVWQYLLFAQRAQRDRRRMVHYCLATLALMVALLSKPSAMVVPLMALLLDSLVVRRPLKAMSLSLAPWFALAGVIAIIAKLVQPSAIVPHMPLWARPLIAGDSLAFYLYKLLVPVKLAIDYGRRPTVVMEQPWFYVMWLVPVALLVLLVLNRRRAPLLLVAMCLFVAGVLPMLGWTRFLFQMHSTTADHYLYLAMLGPALALGWAAQRCNSRTGRVAISIVLVVLGIRTIAQAVHWADDYALFSHTIRVNPSSFAGYNNLANAYYADGDYESAERYYRMAVKLRDDLVVARSNLANVLALQGRIDEAIDQIRAELRIRETQPPDVTEEFSQTYLHVGQLLIRRGRYAEAAEELDRLLQREPRHPEAIKWRAVAGQHLEDSPA